MCIFNLKLSHYLFYSPQKSEFFINDKVVSTDNLLKFVEILLIPGIAK
jgi:hypothetical protein